MCLGEVKVLAIDGADLMELLEEDLQLGLTVMKKVVADGIRRLKLRRPLRAWFQRLRALFNFGDF